MTAGQIIAIVLLFGVAAGIAFGFRYLPQRAQKLLITSVMFLMLSLILTDALRHFFSAGWTFWLSLCAVAIGFVLLVDYAVSEKAAGRIYLWVSVGVVAVSWLFFLILMIYGFQRGVGTYFPAHICRQLLMAFPVVYFMPEKIRKWVLPYLCFGGIAGGIATICVPNNVLMVYSWMQFEVTIVHCLLMWAPVMIFSGRYVIADFRYVPIGLACYGVQIFVAFLFCLANYLQSEEWGNWFYLFSPVRPWFPTWAYALCCLAACLAVGLIVRPLQNRGRGNSKAR